MTPIRDCSFFRDIMHCYCRVAKLAQENKITMRLERVQSRRLWHMIGVEPCRGCGGIQDEVTL